jgi:CARDB
VARYFDITVPQATTALDAGRRAEVVFTVGNATTAPIRGEAIVQPALGTDAAWFTVDRPERSWDVGESDQVAVTVLVPLDAPAGPRSFQLRVQLATGVPEEDFDAGPPVSFEVPPQPVTPPPVPRKPFPWWIVAVVAAVLVILVAGGVFVATRPGPSPTPTPTVAPTPTPSPTPAPTPTPRLLPDLVVADIRIDRHGFFSDTDITAIIENVGQADAGPFLVRIQTGIQIEDREIQGLGAGAAIPVTIQTQPFGFPGNGLVVVDIAGQVEESDESNNERPF